MPHRNQDSTGHDRGVGPEADRIRNVAVVGHIGVGKTTLVEALLHATGVVDRAGDVTEGTTVCDHDPAAIARGHSVATTCAPLWYDGIKVNLLDTPGHPDFVGQLRAGLRAADAALFVVSAVDGLDLATGRLWRECAERNLPRAVAVTRLDHPRADFDEAVALCRRMFGDGVLPAYLPMLGDDESVAGLIGLISQRVHDYTSGHPPVVGEPEAPHLEAIEETGAELVEAALADSEDETLMDRYLAGEAIPADTVAAELETAVARGGLFPVVPVNAVTQVGLDAVLDLIVGAFPPPTEAEPPLVTTVDGSPTEPLRCDPDGPLAAEVVTTSPDRMSLVRVFSGTLRADTEVHVAGHGRSERDGDRRIGGVHAPLGAALSDTGQCRAGDICAITRSEGVRTGDTVSDRGTPLSLSPWDLPEPLLPVAVTASGITDRAALAESLDRLVAADPTLRPEHDPETGQTVLWCLGEAHAELTVDRLRATGTPVDTEPVRTALRRTVAATATGTGRAGGPDRYALCRIEVAPLPRGAGVVFVDALAGDAVPDGFGAAIEDAVPAELGRGSATEYPVVDVRVTLVDGEAHRVDPDDPAVRQAGVLALRDAVSAAGMTLLEPIDAVTVTVAPGYLGAVKRDLTTRRGRILGTDPDPNGDAVVRAEVPAVELLRYVVDLRALTAGSGAVTRRLARHDVVPEPLATQWTNAVAE